MTAGGGSGEREPAADEGDTARAAAGDSSDEDAGDVAPC